jgi:thiamine biosynthesis lipoprotein
VRLWGFGGGDAPAGPPASERIEEVRDLVGYRHVDVRQKDDSYAVYLDTLGARLDLGGVAKGYAVDRCYEALVSEGIGRFIAGIGGNLRCAGGRSSAEPWHIGIRDPFRRGQTLGWVAMSNGMAVASSGDYERFVTIEGKQYSHIIDPRTGRPARGYAQVTVVAPTAAAADALSTALFVLGADETGRVLQDNQDVCALFVPDSPAGQPLATPEFNRLFRPGPGISKVEIIASGRQER